MKQLFYAILLVHSALMQCSDQLSSAASAASAGVAAAFKEDKSSDVEDRVKLLRKNEYERQYNDLRTGASMMLDYINNDLRTGASMMLDYINKKPVQLARWGEQLSSTSISIIVQKKVLTDLLQAVNASNQTDVEAILGLPSNQFNAYVFPEMLESALQLTMEKACGSRISPEIKHVNDFIAVRIMNHTCFNQIYNHDRQKLLKYALNKEYSLVVKEFMKHPHFEKLFSGYLRDALIWAAKDPSESVMEKIMNHPNFNNEVNGYYLGMALNFAINSTDNEKIVKRILAHPKSKEISLNNLNWALKYAKQESKTECADILKTYMAVEHTPYQAASAASAGVTKESLK